MIKALKNLLILLMLSGITVNAQSEDVDSDCNIQFSDCIEKCTGTDDACMDTCEEKHPCPEDEEESSEY